MIKKALTIAGFDASGGAGIQADIKTFSALGCYGMTILTALPIQNTMGVTNCYEIPLKAIEEQLISIFSDITPDVIKIGMLFNAEIINLVATFLATNAKTIPIVLDPVMVAKSGDHLLQPDAVNVLKTKLFPLTTIITPNIDEANILCNMKIQNEQDMLTAGQYMLSLGTQAVLVKGGHLNSDAQYLSHYAIEPTRNTNLKTEALALNDVNVLPMESLIETPTISAEEKHFNTNNCKDLLLSDSVEKWLVAPRIITKNTHGTGCTISAAIAANLAQGADLITSCTNAKDYITDAINSFKDEKIGHGHGPVNHFHQMWTN